MPQDSNGNYKVDIAPGLVFDDEDDVELNISAGTIFENDAISISAGSASAFASALTFSNSNGVSFGLNAGVITASVMGGGGGSGSIQFSAGTLSASRSDITFSNSNGISFGLDTNGVITATVATNYQSLGPYLTTAALSQDSSKYAGTNGAITGGSITVNTSGVSVNLPAYLTTAMQSNAATISNVNVSAGTTSSNVSALTFSNANGVSFGYDGTNVTATVATNYQSQGAYLTTAALSQDSSKYAGTSTGMTGGSVTLNTSGIAINLPAYLTTAALSQDSSKYAGTNGAITGGSITVNTSGVSVNLPAYLTTAMASNAATISNVNLSAGTTSSNLSAFTFSNGSNVSFGLGTGANAGVVTASVNTSLTNINVSAGSTSTNASAFTFSNSNGVSFGIGTGASAGVVTASVAAANLTSWTASDSATSLTIGRLAFTNSNNVTLTLSTGTGGLATLVASVATSLTNINFSAGTTSSNLSALTFSNSNGVSFGVGSGANAGIVTATVQTNYLTTAMLSNAATISNVNISAGTTSTNASAFTLANSNGVSFGLGTGASAGSITATVATNYITTAALSSQTLAFSLSGNTATTNSSQILNGGYALAGGNNVTLQQSNNTVSISVGNYITTADLSQNSSKYAGINSGATNCSVTVNTSGVSVNVGAYITTAALSSQTLAFSLSGNTATTNSSQILNGGYALAGGNNVTLQQSNNTVSISVGNYITTAAQSTQTLLFSISGNVATTNSSQASAGGYVLAGGNNLTIQQSNNSISLSVGNYITTADLSQNSSKYAGVNGSVETTAGTDLALTLNTSGATIAYPKWITTAALSSQTLAFSLSGNTATTNSSQILNGGYALAGGANVTLQQSNNTVSISVAAPGGAPNFSAGTTSSNLNSVVFSNSNGVSFGLSGSTITATVQTNYITTAALSSQTMVFSNSQTYYSTGTIALSEGGGAITIATSAGGQSFKFSVPQTSSIVGVNGISIATNVSTISVSYVPMLSYFVNQDVCIDDNSTTVQPTVSVLQVVPFILPQAVSGAFMRLPVIAGWTSTESAGTTANTTFTFNRTYSTAVVIYTQNTGASSMSLASYTSTLASMVVQHIIGAAGTGSRYTQTQNITYPVSGTTSQYTTSSAQSSANLAFSTNQLTLFTSARFMDIPFAMSLSPGNYWAAFGISSSTASTGGLSNFISGGVMGMSMVAKSESNLSWGVMGVAPNNSVHIMPGLGSWSTNSAVMSTASIQLGSVSSASSHPVPYFQIARFA